MVIKTKETAIAIKMIEYLRDLKWEIYQEVQVKQGPRADIVAVRNGIVMVVECKTSMSLSLLDQISFWIKYANYCCIITPFYPKMFARKTLEMFGIGCFVYYANVAIKEYFPPRLNRSALTRKIKNQLCDAQKTYAPAGNASCSYWSPFKETCKNVQDYVSIKPGITIKEMLKDIKTHYASVTAARTSIVKWIREGIIPGIEIREESGKLKLYTKKEQ